LSPICVAGYWRSRTNEEVRQLYGEFDIVTEIKKGRLRWLGHVERMSEERVVKRLYQNTPEGSRSVGRPRLRWMDDMREDLKRMGVTNWRIRALQNGVHYMGIKIFNNLPPYIKDLSHNVRKFEIYLNRFLHTHSFYSIEEYFQHKHSTN